MDQRARFFECLDSADEAIYQIRTHASGPAGSLPLTDEMLRHWPSGDLFGLTQNAGMGWDPARMLGPQFLILSTQGGVRAPDGTPIALGYHTGHWEVGLLVETAARAIAARGGVPFAGFVSDPCDGRTQGTAGMMDSLPYRNDAAMVLRRLCRSLPMRRGLLAVGTCDKGLPAMLMAVAGLGFLPAVVVPGGVTLPATHGEDAGKVQTIGARYAHGEITLQEAAHLGCSACASPGGGCQFLGTAATTQVIAEALGLTLPHAALAPSGQPVWIDTAARSAEALGQLAERGIATREILSEASIRNAMAVHAACGGSSNLLLHLPAIAFAAGLRRPTRQEWTEINRRVPRIVDVLPNGPVNHPTVRMFLAGGAAEVMLKLRNMGELDTGVLTVSGWTLGEQLRAWEASNRRRRFREMLKECDGVDPDDVIMEPEKAAARGLTSTLCFPCGNLAPEGSVVKSTAIDPARIDSRGIFHMVGPARVFATEREAIRAIKRQHDRSVQPGDVVILCGRGPAGSGMEETAQLTIALRHLPWASRVALVTDARFSGVTTGACIGHVGPEGLAGGPIGRVLDGDTIEITIDCRRLEGRVDLIGVGERRFSADEGAAVLASRRQRDDLQPDEQLPDDTRLWAALQRVGGGTWGGCVYDVDRIIQLLEVGEQSVQRQDVAPDRSPS
jgi:putative YjhG/YagF family dehydratase